MRIIHSSLALLAVLGIGSVSHGGQEVRRQALFADMQFRQGFLLSHPDSSRGRSVEAVLNLDDAGNVPVWRLCQWATKYSLATVPCIRADGPTFSYENDAKRVVVGGPDSASRDLILEIRGGTEYGSRPRKYGESWPHLLVEQDAIKLCPLDELADIQFKISLRLMHCTNRMSEGQNDPSLHAAQFQMFFIIKNIDSASEDRGSYYWFGVPFFDSRHDVPPAFMAKDAGKNDATGKFIYTVDGKSLGIPSLKDGRWASLQADLLPHILTGLHEAVNRGYLKSRDPHGYAIANMNLGWEIPGTFDVAAQIKDLSIVVDLRND